MAEETKVPRINAALMPTFNNRLVRLVVHVERLDHAHESVEVTTSDRQIVHVKTKNFQSFETPYVEVVGKVLGDNVLEEITAFNLGNEFGTIQAKIVLGSAFNVLNQGCSFVVGADLETYNQALQLTTGKYHYLFD